MKETYYFKHDYHARTDEKIVELLKEHGPAGYGLYWMLIEKIYENGGWIGANWTALAFDLRVEPSLVESICTDFDLFKRVEDRLSSTSVDRRLDERKAIAALGRETIAKRLRPDGSPWVRDSPLVGGLEGGIYQERKEKERKTSNGGTDVNVISKNGSERAALESRFARFWHLYPNKQAKLPARKAWDKIKPPEDLLAVILKALEAQKSSQGWLNEGGRFIPLPASWLNARRWEDEVNTGGTHARANPDLRATR